MKRVRRLAGPAFAAVTLAFVIERLGTGPFVTAARAVDGRWFLAAAAIAPR